jgi:hypothetical protein
MGQFLRYYLLAFSLFVREPTFRVLGLAALLTLLVGTVFYHFAEGWSWADSLYFTTVTLASVGYGDFVPSSELARLFTVLYIILGLGIVAGFLSTLIKAPLMMQEGQVPLLPFASPGSRAPTSQPSSAAPSTGAPTSPPSSPDTTAGARAPQPPDSSSTTPTPMPRPSRPGSTTTPTRRIRRQPPSPGSPSPRRSYSRTPGDGPDATTNR